MQLNHLIDGQIVGSAGTLPREPGVVRIPSGTVRLYHQTSAASLELITMAGLSLHHAKGIEGPKAIYASETGFYGKPGNIPTLEFFVELSQWDDPFVLEEVPVSQMIAAHYPWHSLARYVLSDPSTLEEVLAGEHDDLIGDYQLAVDYVKRHYL